MGGGKKMVRDFFRVIFLFKNYPDIFSSRN